MRTPALLLGLIPLALGGCKDPSAPNPLSHPAAATPTSTPSPPPQLRAPDPDAVAHSVSTSAPASIQQPAHITFMQDAIELVGSNLDPAQPQAGNVVTVTNYYKVNRKPDGEWKLFAHIAAVQGGQLRMMGNHDHDPVEGKYPVSQWQPGQVIADTWQMQLPTPSPPQVAVLIGLWNDQGRMPVDPPAAGEQARTDGQGQVLAALFQVGGAGATATSAPTNAPPIPTYIVSKTSTPPVIDGKLGDPAWEKAASTGPFVASMNGAPTHTQTTAKLLYDDQFLYVAFDVHDEDIWGTKTQHDDAIFGEEAVEIFIDANGDGRTYNELEVSPHNVTFDAAFTERRVPDWHQAIQWESGMQTAVQIDGTLDNPDDVDRGWTVEMKIPIANLTEVLHTPPQVGDLWRFNLYRLDWYNHRHTNEGQAYSPVLVGDFHNLARFAYLKFGG